MAMVTMAKRRLKEFEQFLTPLSLSLSLLQEPLPRHCHLPLCCRVADCRGWSCNDNGDLFADEKTMVTWVSFAGNPEPWILLDFLLIIIISGRFNLIIAGCAMVEDLPFVY